MKTHPLYGLGITYLENFIPKHIQADPVKFLMEDAVENVQLVVNKSREQIQYAESEIKMFQEYVKTRPELKTDPYLDMEVDVCYSMTQSLYGFIVMKDGVPVLTLLSDITSFSDFKNPNELATLLVHTFEKLIAKNYINE
jgi:hypothetical protein